MNDSHKFVQLQFHEQSPMSLEGFDIRKDDYDYLKKQYMSQRVGFDFSDIKIMSKSEQRDVIIKLQQRVFLSYSNHIILFYWLKLNLKIKLLLKAFCILKRSPKLWLFNDSLQLFGSVKIVLHIFNVYVAFVGLLRWCLSVNVCHIKASETCTWMTR